MVQSLEQQMFLSLGIHRVNHIAVKQGAVFRGSLMSEKDWTSYNKGFVSIFLTNGTLTLLEMANGEVEYSNGVDKEKNWGP